MGLCDWESTRSFIRPLGQLGTPPPVTNRVHIIFLFSQVAQDLKTVELLAIFSTKPSNSPDPGQSMPPQKQQEQPLDTHENAAPKRCPKQPDIFAACLQQTQSSGIQRSNRTVDHPSQHSQKKPFGMYREQAPTPSTLPSRRAGVLITRIMNAKPRHFRRR